MPPFISRDAISGMSRTQNAARSNGVLTRIRARYLVALHAVLSGASTTTASTIVVS